MPSALDAAARARFAKDDFALLPGAVGADAARALWSLADSGFRTAAASRSNGKAFAVRDALGALPGLMYELRALGLDTLASEALGGAAVPIDATLFDKRTTANWPVGGHQDRVLPFAAAPPGRSFFRRGSLFAEPPLAAFSKLAALRLHGDDCDETSGALALVPGSAARIWSDADLGALSLADYLAVPARTGDVLLMRPLTVHRSSPTAAPGRRRTLHVVYATGAPPSGHRWWTIGDRA